MYNGVMGNKIMNKHSTKPNFFGQEPLFFNLERPLTDLHLLGFAEVSYVQT